MRGREDGTRTAAAGATVGWAPSGTRVPGGTGPVNLASTCTNAYVIKASKLEGFTK